jgi:NAD(P)-dependent dehydrogenase (short-subunit alcohol dehydrogenase family)
MAKDDAARVAVVTGANRGIGLEVCRQLAGRGYTVVLGSRDAAKGAEAAATIASAGRVIARQVDVTDAGSIERLRDWLGERFGRLDVLVNNAAINYDNDQRAATVDLGSVDETLDTNLLGAWRATQLLLPLIRRGAHGRIVNVSSEAGSLAALEHGGAPAYAVSKAALNAFTRILAAELRGSGILVNAVCPGWVATDMGGAGGRPVAEGAASVVWAATLPDDGPTNGFFRDGRPIGW